MGSQDSPKPPGVMSIDLRFVGGDTADNPMFLMSIFPFKLAARIVDENPEIGGYIDDLFIRGRQVRCSSQSRGGCTAYNPIASVPMDVMERQSEVGPGHVNHNKRPTYTLGA